MIVSCSGEARFLIKETGETIAVMPQEIAWDSDGTGDGGMGPKIRHWATKEFDFPASGQSISAIWELWEYPLGVENFRQTKLSEGLEMLENFDIHLFPDDGPTLDLNFMTQEYKVWEPEDPPRAMSLLTKVRVESLAEQDFLGRERIKEALHKLITERDSTQHFALGLFGSWGCGKSSLILQLTKRLEQENPDILVAEFNAWKNEKANNIGAMLAQSVVERLTEDLSPWQKITVAAQLVVARNAWFLKWANQCPKSIPPWLLLFLPSLMLSVVVVVLVCSMPLPAGDWSVWVKSVLVVSSITALFRSVFVFLRNNLGEWFKNISVQKVFSYLRLPSYAEHRGLAGEIHQTLGRLCSLQLGAAGKERTLLLVVDDLDRCTVSTVKEVFDAVRLVADIPHVITLVAVDEQMAFAAVEKHYEHFGHAGRLPANIAREYLGKVLQASLTLSVADDESVRRFVADVLFPGVGLIGHSSSVKYLDESQVSSGSSYDSATDATLQDRANRPSAEEVRSRTKPLAVTSQSALPEEVLLFRDLAILYDFRNPRLMGRLHLSWRLLKALVFDGRPYAIMEVANHMRLLFWREYRLQQDVQCRETLDHWLADGCVQNGPQHLVPALGPLAKAMIGTVMGSNWDNAVNLADAILLPASAVVVKK